MFKDVVEIGKAIGNIYAGYGAVGAFVGGLEEINDLYSAMPKGSFREKRKYFQKNRKEFASAAHTTADGVTKIVRAVNTFEGLLGGRSTNSDEQAEVRQQIQMVKTERAELFREVSARKHAVEQRWSKIADELFWARAAARSVERNVAIIIQDAVANKLIHSLQMEGQFYNEFVGCVTAFNVASVPPGAFNSTPIREACGGLAKGLNRLEICVAEKQKTDVDLVVEGRTKVFRIGRDTDARKCFTSRLWGVGSE